jgi:aminomethyltransferase
MEPKKLPLHHIHEQYGAKIASFAGYLMPVRYTSDKEEHLAVRNNAGIFDVSHMGEFIVRGPKALELIQQVTSNDASKLVPGKAQYSCLTNDKGGIVDDLIVYMLLEDEYLLVVNAANIEKDWNWISGKNNAGAELENISDDICLFAVQGPKATEILQQLTETALPAIKFYHFKKGTFAGKDNVIMSATGYTGAGGFEIYVNKEDAEDVFKDITEAGSDYGIKPIGLGARDTLRMEMGYCLYGNDIDETTSPIEAGLGWVTKFTKDFPGKEIFERQKEEGVTQKLAGFKMVDKGIPRQGYAILNGDGDEIGRVTSGTMSPSMNVGIGLGYVKTSYSSPGTSIFIDIRRKPVEAKINKLPLFNQ